MEKKLSAYQKLKAENQRLKQDIYALIRHENSDKPRELINFISVKIRWEMRFKLDDAVWYGEPTKLG